MPDPGTLMLGILFGSIGVGYFIYGKKQSNPVVLAAGLVLIAVPYFIGNNYVLAGVCIAIMLAPKFIPW